MADPNPVPNTPGGNPLEELIPVNKRKKVYAVLGVAGLVLTVLQVAVLMTNTDGHEPMWLKVIIVCFNLLTAPVFALANANAKVLP
jgi:multisubunit Na+/H+ antiporter MnhG subunit